MSEYQCPNCRTGYASDGPWPCPSCGYGVSLEGSRPTGPVTPRQLEENGLHWVLCGGVQVGLRTHPKVWRLRPKDEVEREAQRAKDLQRLASAARLIHSISEYFGDSCTHELAYQVREWLGRNKTK